jgi:hypothetical protein
VYLHDGDGCRSRQQASLKTLEEQQKKSAQLLQALQAKHTAAKQQPAASS